MNLCRACRPALWKNEFLPLCAPETISDFLLPCLEEMSDHWSILWSCGFNKPFPLNLSSPYVSLALNNIGAVGPPLPEIIQKGIPIPLRFFLLT